MEEAELVKERLQAIMNKRRIQQDIASKRLEIDREKLKLQHFKKKSMRDLWLMSGANTGGEQDEQKAQDDAQQTKLLQSNIHRIEKEIEALEREELNISMREELILKRLKSIEKSTEDIIKAANDKFRSESIQIYSGTQDAAKSYTPLNTRKQPSVDLESKANQQNPAPGLFAMEINVQKDLRTGESRVLSACTVSAQELQQRGIKVYDDGRKSVYAVSSGQPATREVDELSLKEVEDLLKQATEKKNKPQEINEAQFNMNCERIRGTAAFNTDGNEWPELEYVQSDVRYPEQEVQEPAQMFHPYRDEQRYYHANHASYEMYQNETPCDPSLSDESHRETQTVLPNSRMNHRTSSSCPNEDPKPCIGNALPLDEPVTMIFMGYQRAEEDAQTYDGSVEAELVVIEDVEEELLTGGNPQRRLFHPEQKRNTRVPASAPTEFDRWTNGPGCHGGRLKMIADSK